MLNINSIISSLKSDDDKVYNLDNVEGKLLVASPALDDLQYGRSLIYVCVHDEGGAVGIMVNHHVGFIQGEDMVGTYGGNNRFSDAIKKKKYPVLAGGNINTDMVVALGVTKEQERLFNKSITSKANLYLDAAVFIKDLMSGASKISKCIFSRGICAWDAGQLEQELMADAWLVTDATVPLIFSQKKEDKWAHVMKKQFNIGEVSNVVTYAGSD